MSPYSPHAKNHFNPRSLTGATVSYFQSQKSEQFQSTLPYGSDKVETAVPSKPPNFNPRSLTGATQVNSFLFPAGGISIHAPLRERLPDAKKYLYGNTISIHAPLRERPHQYQQQEHCHRKFQSTLPYGSDKQDNAKAAIIDCISIHAPLRERPYLSTSAFVCSIISIHAPLRERRSR